MVKFSVVMSVYQNDKPEFVQRAVYSVSTLQTLSPNEIVLVVDGPVPGALKALIEHYEKSELFNIVWLLENKGLGNALKVGVEVAKYPIIARMDSDDVSHSDRFEKQIKYLEENPDCDLVGGQMSEFIGSEDNIIGNRYVPYIDYEIKSYLKSRCPLNHVTIMMKKTSVLIAGNLKSMVWHLKINGRIDNLR